MTTNFRIPQEIIDNLHIPQVVNIVDELPVNPVKDWIKLCGKRDLNDITTIVLHHDAIGKEKSAQYTDVVLAQRIATTHINSKRNEKTGDGGFPYHFWIRNGKVYQANDIQTFTYGVRSNNGYTVHVSVSGNYYGDKNRKADLLEDADRLALVGIVTALKRGLPKFKAIKSHDELDKTNCPGYDENQIRSAVAALDIELIKQADKWDSKINKCDKLRNEIVYMLTNINKGEKDGDAQKSMKKLMLLYDVMKKNNILPPTAP